MDMAATEGGKGPRDKEISAVMCNLKEQRVLEKSLQTLQLEQTYSLKLLDLGNRDIKVRYRKLKDKVSKIKSHLAVEDIIRLTQLDQKGKLKPIYKCEVLSSAVKIAAASRRLNLNSERFENKRSVQSALPTISVRGDTEVLTRESSDCLGSVHILEALSRVPTNASLQNMRRRPQTASAHLYSDESQHQLKSLPKEVEDSLMSNSPELSIKKDNLAVPEADHTMHPGEKSGRVHRAHSAYPHSHSPFSSHVSAKKDAREGLSTAPEQYVNMRRLSHISRDSIDSNLGEDIYEEHRLELLEEENLRAEALEERTRTFLRQMEEYLQKNPPLNLTKATFHNPRPVSSSNKPSWLDSNNFSQRRKFQKRNELTDIEFTPTYLPEPQYKERLSGLWKGMNMCRYLRLPDERLDLSGINTLVKDQMKLFDVLRHADRRPLREAWEN